MTSNQRPINGKPLPTTTSYVLNRLYARIDGKSMGLLPQHRTLGDYELEPDFDYEEWRRQQLDWMRRWLELLFDPNFVHLCLSTLQAWGAKSQLARTGVRSRKQIYRDIFPLAMMLLIYWKIFEAENRWRRPRG